MLSWSYQHLPTAAARSFRLLGLHPGPDLDPYAAAALTDTTPEHARSLLSLLARAHLIQPARHGRYNMRDLLRAYARSLAAEAQHGTEEGRGALTRLFDYYLTATAAAMQALAPTEQNRRPHVAAPILPMTVPPVATPGQARAWLDAERVVLVAVTAHAAAHGWAGHATRLAATLSRYLVTGGHNTDAVAIHTHALNAARGACDRGAEAAALIDLSEVRWRLGHCSQEAARYEQALLVLRDIGARAGEARALDNLGAICWRQGRYEEAAVYHRRTLEVTAATYPEFLAGRRKIMAAKIRDHYERL